MNYHARNRRYGRTHRDARTAALRTYRTGQPCALGGEPLTDPPHLLDLAHDGPTHRYLGLACRNHNRGEAVAEQRAINKATRREDDPRPQPRTRW